MNPDRYFDLCKLRDLWEDILQKEPKATVSMTEAFEALRDVILDIDELEDEMDNLLFESGF